MTVETELKGVEDVRKMLMELDYEPPKCENITATPLHRAVESCDKDNVRNLLKGTDANKFYKDGDIYKLNLQVSQKTLKNIW